MAPAIRLTETLYKPPDCAPRTPRLLHVRTLVAKITASTEGSTRSSPSTLSDPLNLLRQIPLKYIFFHQDVRPPYIGTHTKFRSQHDISKIVRNPNKRVRPELDYDYDSEAEWQEPEEGDEVESNAESEGESNSNVDPDEMDDFLDDEETADGVRARRKLFTNDMTPICSGICWEDVHGHHVDTGGAHNTRAYKMEIIQSKFTWFSARRYFLTRGKNIISYRSILSRLHTGLILFQTLQQRMGKAQTNSEHHCKRDQMQPRVHWQPSSANLLYQTRRRNLRSQNKPCDCSRVKSWPRSNRPYKAVS